MLKSPGITLRATNAMILSAGLLLLPFASASCNVGYWDCMTNGDLDNLGFVDRLSICYTSCYRMRLNDNNNDEDDDDTCDFPNQKILPKYRLSTGSNPGSDIMCWPSKGGIYQLSNVHNVQRQFLGLERRVAKLLRPEVSADVEDAFCNQRKQYTCTPMCLSLDCTANSCLVRKLGAQWWESECKYIYGEVFVSQYTGRSAPDKPVLYVGWPASGGVWALSMDPLEAAKEGYGVIYNSLTMEEQCEMIQEFGGTFYQDPKDCPYLDLPENESIPSLSHPSVFGQTPSTPSISSAP